MLGEEGADPSDRLPERPGLPLILVGHAAATQQRRAMADGEELEFTCSPIDRIFRLSLGELADLSGAKYDGDLSLSLEAGQRRKHEYVAEQIGIAPGRRVLDLDVRLGSAARLRPPPSRDPGQATEVAIRAIVPSPGPSVPVRGYPGIMSWSLSANRNGALDGAVPGRGLAGPARGLFVGCGLAVMLGGLAVLSGWEFGVERLKNLSPGAVSMKPNAAAAFVLCGLALLLCGNGIGRASRARLAAITVFAGVAAAVGGLTLVEYATGTNLGIDQLLFHEHAHIVATASPGRMALLTALGLVLSGCALAALARRKAVVGQVLAGVLLLIALSGALGYLYGADLTRPWGSTQVSADTVAVLTILGLGLLIAIPDVGLVAALLRDDPGGLMARWLLLAATITLPTLGILRLAGQHAGLYNAGAGVGIMVLASLLVVLVTVGLTSIKINALDRQRWLALEDLAASDRRLRKSLDHLLHVQQNERRGLAIDLHDDALPALSAIGLQLELARERCQDPDVCERLSQAEVELRATRVRLRHLMLDLVPEVLRQEGLGYVLRHRLEQMQGLSGLDYELIDRVGKQPSPQATAILYRIALEALRNVARHSDANRVRVELEHRNGRAQLTVADDGIGFRPSSPKPGHLGLSIMAERAELAGGGIQIDSQPGEGTAVVAWVPAGVTRSLETDCAPLLEEAAAHRSGNGGGSI